MKRSIEQHVLDQLLHVSEPTDVLFSVRSKTGL